MTRTIPLAVLVSASSVAVAALAVPAGVIADDTGDAPQRYGIASHGVAEPALIWLGDTAPDEEKPVFSLGADGDDNTGDDEDGVFAFPDLVQNGKSYTTNVFATNLSSAPVTLAGWVDIDGNGQFDGDEYATASVPAGTHNDRFKLRWPDLRGVGTDYVGDTYARFRISSTPMGAGSASGRVGDGEVEDYPLIIQPDADADGRPDATDPDDDNDGIPDDVEVIGRDTDGDGIPDYLDSDSDADGVSDFIEAGPTPDQPADSDGDGIPDYLDRDSDNDGLFDGEDDVTDRDGDGVLDSLEGGGDADSDGVPNWDDLDADNDSIPDGLERGDRPDVLRDTDGDRVPDLFDLDSDDDGIPDLYEANSGEFNPRSLDFDVDGRLDTAQAFGANGFADALEVTRDSGIPRYAVPDTDGDGVRDFRDRDSDGDGVSDLREAGRPDRDEDGQVDERIDADADGLVDAVDVDSTGGADIDGDGIDDAYDPSVTQQPDFDGDGIADAVDNDVDGDGITEGANARRIGELPDANGDGIPDFQDAEIPTSVPGAGTAGGTDGSTDGGTTTGGGTGGDGGTGDGPTTDGGTDDGGQSPSDDDPGRIETGLSGGAGCSVASVGSGAGMDPLFALGLLGAWFGLMRGGRRRGCQHLVPNRARADGLGTAIDGDASRTN